MARINRKAFTLVEMLVVIVIISMLVAMLVPAVISARERARRSSCANNQNQVGKAIIQYETAKGQLPGYVNELGGGTLRRSGGGVASNNNLSWVVVVLENLGRADLWKEWRKKSTNRADVTVALSEVLCPSDLEKSGKSGALSFAVNCGISDERATDVPAYTSIASTAYDEPGLGLFFDHDSSGSGSPYGLPGSRVVEIGLDGIGDGAQQTIMLSENLQAGNWSSELIPNPPAGATPVRQADVGIVWWSSSYPFAPPLASGFPDPSMLINGDLVTAPNSRIAARPSSNHPGGVNAVFADGHSDFMSERMDYDVFRDLMISNQTKVKELGLIP